MKNIIVVVLFSVFLVSCSTQKSLYSWGNYEKTSYNYLKNSNEQSEQELIEEYQKIINKEGGIRNSVPPGVYADYGFILLKEGKKKEGESLLKKEMSSYPEARVFMERIIKMINR